MNKIKKEIHVRVNMIHSFYSSIFCPPVDLTLTSLTFETNHHNHVCGNVRSIRIYYFFVNIDKSIKKPTCIKRGEKINLNINKKVHACHRNNKVYEILLQTMFFLYLHLYRS
jgi:hypothetical protein